MLNKRQVGLIIAVVILLLIPLVAMRFTDEVNWNGFDFLVAGILLMIGVFALELGIAKAKNLRSKLVFGLLILGALILVWAELAVGIFGTPFAGS